MRGHWSKDFLLFDIFAFFFPFCFKAKGARGTQWNCDRKLRVSKINYCRHLIPEMWFQAGKREERFGEKKSGKEKDLAGKQEIISGVNQASLRRDEKEENTQLYKVLKHNNKRKLWLYIGARVYALTRIQKLTRKRIHSYEETFSL